MWYIVGAIILFVLFRSSIREEKERDEREKKINNLIEKYGLIKNQPTDEQQIEWWIMLDKNENSEKQEAYRNAFGLWLFRQLHSDNTHEDVKRNYETARAIICKKQEEEFLEEQRIEDEHKIKLIIEAIRRSKQE